MQTSLVLHVHLFYLLHGGGPGDLSAPCDIPIINDRMVEQDETFSLSERVLNTNGQLARFTVGGDSASATIIDDDGTGMWFICPALLLYNKETHWKKMEVDLTQDGSPQLQDNGPYHPPLFPQCRVTAFCVLKVPIRHEYLCKST